MNAERLNPCKHGHTDCAHRAGGPCFDAQVNAAAASLVRAYFEREAQRRDGLRGRLSLSPAEIAAICDRHGLRGDEHEAAIDQAAEEYREAARDAEEERALRESEQRAPLDPCGPWGAP